MQDWLTSPATVNGSLSLDRSVFLLKSPGLSLWSSNGQEKEHNKKKIRNFAMLSERILRGNLDEDFQQGSPSELFQHHYRTSDGIDIQFGSCLPKRKKITDLAILEAFGTDSDKEAGFMYDYSPNEYGFRVEFNPNNTSLNSVKNLLRNFSACSDPLRLIRISRLDIAIDFYASIVPELVLCNGMRKSFTASGSKGLESIYFGTRQSKNYIRLYDKRQEQIDKTGTDSIGRDMWRLELESKEAFFLDKVPDFGKVFQRISFFEGAVSSGDWMVDLIRSQAMQFGLQNVLRRMPKMTAHRYRKAFSEKVFHQDIETPFFVYEREFKTAFERLSAHILDVCGYKLTT